MSPLAAFPAPERCQVCLEDEPHELLIVRHHLVHVCLGCSRTLASLEYVRARHESLQNHARCLAEA